MLVKGLLMGNLGPKLGRVDETIEADPPGATLVMPLILHQEGYFLR